MVRVRDSETAVSPSGSLPLSIQDRRFFPTSSLFAGLAGAILAPLIDVSLLPDRSRFASPDAVPLAVMVGGAGFVAGRLIGRL